MRRSGDPARRDAGAGAALRERGSCVPHNDQIGKTYYFCAKGCKVAFDKEPEKYLKAEGEKKQN